MDIAICVRRLNEINLRHGLSFSTLKLSNACFLKILSYDAWILALLDLHKQLCKYSRIFYGWWRIRRIENSNFIRLISKKYKLLWYELKGIKAYFLPTWSIIDVSKRKKEWKCGLLVALIHLIIQLPLPHTAL